MDQLERQARDEVIGERLANVVPLTPKAKLGAALDVIRWLDTEEGKEVLRERIAVLAHA